MIRSRFQHILKHPEDIDSDDLQQLERLSEQYPWFGQAKTLIAKALNDKDDHRAKAWTKKAASQSQNRSALKRFLLETDFKDALLSKHRALESDKKASVDTSTENSIDKNAHVVAPMIEQSEEQLQVNNSLAQSETQAERQSDSSPDGEEQTLEQPQEAKQAPLQLDALDEAIIVEAISTTIGIEADEFAAEEATLQSEAKTQDSEELTKVQDEVSGQPSSSNEPEKSDDLAEVTKETPTQAKESFSAWLTKRSLALGYSNTLEEVSALPELKQPTENRPEGKEAIIDRFIKTQPQISRLKASDEVQAASDRSLQNDDTLVTETLAEIYAQQGHMKKAIKAYEHLGLAYPEKSVYFVARIKKLKERHK